MAGYCTVDDVCSGFPSFKRNATGSVPDTDIQKWIDQYKAEIRAAMMSRQFDPDAVTLTGDQANFLKLLNRLIAGAELGDVLHATITLQPVEYPESVQARKHYERLLDEIKAGLHDSLFLPNNSRNVVTGPLFAGVGGSETERGVDNRLTQNRSFSRGQRF